MLNYIWGVLILLGIGFGLVYGKADALSNGVIDSAGEAVTLAITMLGIMAMWMGIMEIARKAGVLSGLTNRCKPLLSFLFPDIPENHIVREYIAANLIANVLGLGWAATPMGLKAMKELAKYERSKPEKEGSEKVSDEMCTFLVLNISSLQIIPVTVIAYRTQYGAVNPSNIVLPGLIATSVSTIAAIVFCKICSRHK